MGFCLIVLGSGVEGFDYLVVNVKFDWVDLVFGFGYVEGYIYGSFGVLWVVVVFGILWVNLCFF